MKIDGMPDDKLMFTVSEVADILGLTSAYIRQVIIAGGLRAEKLGHAWVIYRHDFETFITEREQARRERGR